MQQMMKKMGIQQAEIQATRVVIYCRDKEIIINDPQVTKVNMMGQQTYQVVGEAEERSLSSVPEISEEDINTVMEQAHVSKAEAKKAIEDANGDLAEAILNLGSRE